MAKILLIEADPNLSKAITAILEIAGHQVISTVDGGSGLLLAREHSPALILCNVSLSHSDGLALLNSVRDNADVATLPFVLLATHLTGAQMQKAVDLRANGILLKPFTEAELLQLLTNTLSPK